MTVGMMLACTFAGRRGREGPDVLGFGRPGWSSEVKREVPRGTELSPELLKNSRLPENDVVQANVRSGWGRRSTFAGR